MWYVAQTMSGSEHKMLRMLDRYDTQGVVAQAFVPRRELMRKQHGEWTVFTEALFPGYAFIQTDEPAAVNELLLRLSNFARLLGTDEEFTPLSSREELEMLRLMGLGKRAIKVSCGVIEGDKVIVLQGPLRGYEGYITKVDRHKRIAILNMKILGRCVDVKLGLEIIHKS